MKWMNMGLKKRQHNVLSLLEGWAGPLALFLGLPAYAVELLAP